jgi:hypothetical protein
MDRRKGRLDLGVWREIGEVGCARFRLGLGLGLRVGLARLLVAETLAAAAGAPGSSSAWWHASRL